MELTEEQKKIIETIAEKRITNVYDLLCKGIMDIIKIPDKKDTTIEIKTPIEITKYLPYYYPSEAESDEILIKIANIDCLCKTLQNKGIIYICNTDLKLNIPIFFIEIDGKNIVEQRINDFLKRFDDTIILAAPVLYDFIKNDYKTTEEIELISEREARKSAEQFTKGIAIFSIIVSLIIGIGTTIFSYLTNTKEREMIIKNPGEINYPVEIKNIDKFLEMQENNLQKMDEMIELIYKNESTAR